jgi:hypothetical protein
MTTTTRPGFLTVLCILSYIGCGLAILGVISTITTLPGILNLVATLICLWGVIQMWQLKKMGFYIYLVGEIAPLVISIATIGFAGMFNFAGGLMALAMAFGFLFSVIFILLYALNLKHLH